MSKRLEGRIRRKQRIRNKIFGTTAKPRLTIYRSLKHIYAQLIDDTQGKTIVSASTLDKDNKQFGSNKSNAVAVGKRLAEKAKAAQVETVVFDRNGYIYHGIIKSFADAVREEGLKF